MWIHRLRSETVDRVGVSDAGVFLEVAIDVVRSWDRELLRC